MKLCACTPVGRDDDLGYSLGQRIHFHCFCTLDMYILGWLSVVARSVQWLDVCALRRLESAWLGEVVYLFTAMDNDN